MRERGPRGEGKSTYVQRNDLTQTCQSGDSGSRAPGLLPVRGRSVRRSLSGVGAAIRTGGIGGKLTEIARLLPSANRDAKLTLVLLMSQGACQYTFYSPSKRASLAFVDMQGTMRLMGTRQITGSAQAPLPDTSVRLAGCRRRRQEGRYGGQSEVGKSLHRST